MDRVDYRTALIEQNQLLSELIASADPSTEVPTCPGWTLLQLVRHVGRGDRWAAQMVAERMREVLDPRAVRDGKPPSDLDGALAWLRGSPKALLDAVAATGPKTPVWTFTGPRPAEWWIRRRLHESTVHRADVAIALGREYVLTPELAADAISEWLDLMAARSAGQNSTDRGVGSDGDARPVLQLGVPLHLHATDDGLGEAGEWLIVGTPEGVRWEPGHGKGAAALRGRAVHLLLALTRRRTAEEVEVQLYGDAGVWTTWLDRTPF